MNLLGKLVEFDPEFQTVKFKLAFLTEASISDIYNLIEKEKVVKFGIKETGTKQLKQGVQGKWFVTLCRILSFKNIPITRESLEGLHVSMKQILFGKSTIIVLNPLTGNPEEVPVTPSLHSFGDDKVLEVTKNLQLFYMERGCSFEPDEDLH